MDLQSNPVKCYKNFDILIAEGQKLYFDPNSIDLSEFSGKNQVIGVANTEDM